jgi:NADPH-dependent glutamate synthase beta subunit-like oxidoreductase
LYWANTPFNPDGLSQDIFKRWQTMQNVTGKHVAIIGGGPAGLMAAEIMSRQSVRVDLYDAMPSVGRKFWRAKAN